MFPMEGEEAHNKNLRIYGQGDGLLPVLVVLLLVTTL
jgi:hypothetical protein